MRNVPRFFRKLGRSIRKRIVWHKKPVFSAPAHAIMPDWAAEELRHIADIEPALYPSKKFLKQFHHYQHPPVSEPGKLYARILQETNIAVTDMIILVPWLIRGGADLGVLHHINAALAAGYNVLVIATRNSESTWKHRIPSEVQFLEFGKFAAKLSEEHQLTVLVRLLLQSSAKTIHIINSHLGWLMLRHYGKPFVTENRKIYASAYCDDYNRHNVRWSYPCHFVADCYQYLSGIICDSAWYPEDLKRQFGIAAQKIHTVYFPARLPDPPVYRSFSENRILWAGRLTRQKRPDLLIETAKSLPHVTFCVYGYTYNKRDKKYEQELRKLNNVELHGPYDSFESLVKENRFTLFFYTSAWDGLPNVLLEAVAYGLPVVASAVCGVPEFISEDTGYPVFETQEVSAYTERISEALNNSEERHERWKNALDLLQSRHSQTHFLQSLQSINGYFKPVNRPAFTPLASNDHVARTTLQDTDKCNVQSL